MIRIHSIIICSPARMMKSTLRSHVACICSTSISYWNARLRADHNRNYQTFTFKKKRILNQMNLRCQIVNGIIICGFLLLQASHSPTVETTLAYTHHYLQNIIHPLKSSIIYYFYDND